MPVLKIWSDDLLPLIFVSFLVASAVVSLSFCVTTFSVWLERQDPYPLDSCIRGSFVLSPVGLLFLCMANSPLPLWKLAQLCHSTRHKDKSSAAEGTFSQNFYAIFQSHL